MKNCIILKPSLSWYNNNNNNKIKNNARFIIYVQDKNASVLNKYLISHRHSLNILPDIAGFKISPFTWYLLLILYIYWTEGIIENMKINI